MAKLTGFLDHQRVDRGYRPTSERLTHYQEFVVNLDNKTLQQQASRCMDCGIPYCHNGCPVNNIIPEFNDLVYQEDWRRASEVLHSTNNFPEFTGRVCPAPCEASCTLNIEDQPVTIKTIEHAIVEKAWQMGWIKPQIAPKKTGFRVAVVGSGPAGMACAQQLARSGHRVSMYEKQNRSGGLLRYGIPDFKLNKQIIDRRMAQMKTEGVEFHANTHVGVDISVSYLRDNFDAVVLSGGAEVPRDLDVPGRAMDGVHFAMDFLRSNTKVVQGEVAGAPEISAAGKHVVVIGGGDTGSDCIGTSNRHGAAKVTQIEILSQPPEHEDKALTWPNWPHKMRTSSSHEEGCERLWDVVTKSFFADEDGQLAGLNCAKVAWHRGEDGQWQMREIEGSEFVIEAQLATLAMGFVHPVYAGMLESFGISRDPRGNVEAATAGERAYQTNIDGMFSAGDMRRGQSLVVWAIREGRECAASVDAYLTQG